MIYEWRKGSRYKGDPQVVGDTVSRLAKSLGGVCPPEAVVNEARDPESPLHPIVFRMDRDQAAEAWYKQEARQVIGDLTVVLEGTSARPAAFLSIELIDSNGPRVGYARRDVVMSSPEAHDQAVEEALAALNGWRRRYRHLTELEHVFAAIDATV